MKINKHIFIYLLILCISFVCTQPIHAANETPDSSQKGSLSFSLEYKGKPVEGGSVNIYLVAIEDEDATDGWSLTKEFADCKINMKDLESKTNAVSLSEYIKKKNIKGSTIYLDSRGKGQMNNLASGLYFVEQNKAAAGFNPINAFLIRIPMYDGKQYIYNVDASPKVDISKPDKPSGGNGGGDGDNHNPPGGGNGSSGGGHSSRLPQTGQLWWPVPILAIIGMLCYGYGWKKGRDE